MTLTQELAQALRHVIGWIDRKHSDPPFPLGVADIVAQVRAALARYDAEPPTSRGSEGEAKPVAWYVDCVNPETELRFRSFTLDAASVTARHTPLYAAPPPSQPSAEAWRQAIIECVLGSEHGLIARIETRARELHAASCAKSEEPK